MKILARIRDALSFTPGPTTLVAVLVYAVIFTSVLVTDELPNVPKQKKWKGLNFTRAYEDLHIIAARPHPFIVRANDDVRDYILARVNKVASVHSDFVHVDDDMRTNASWAGGTPLASAGAFGIYFEGTNVLVKIDGTNANKSDAVLFSAHYDSVSSASGATDDGMGVATLLALIDYLAERRPKRTAIFNINNGEEDGLHGAHIFMEHPWSKLTKIFLNLEGAAAGGRPLLFRATSLAPARAFRVPHPHTNALAADAFRNGLIRSATDYSVYTAGNGSAGTGLEGLDYAFYKGRSKYHTKWDALPHTMGGKRALWAMMEGARGTAEKLLNGKESSGKGDAAVYFDLLGKALVVFPLNWLFILDIVLLVLGPIAVLAILLLTVFRARREREVAGQAPPQTGAKELIMVLLGWARFWVAVGIAALALVLLSIAYIKINPFVVHSRSIGVLISFLTLSYLALILPLSFTHLRPSVPLSATSARQQKLATLLESYALMWGILLASTISVGRLGAGSSYLITFWNLSLLLGTLVALFEAWLRARGTAGKSDVGAGNSDAAENGEYAERVLVRGVRYDAGGTGTGARAYRIGENGQEEGEVRVRDAEGEGVVVETEPTEITPLMAQHRSSSRDSSTSRRHKNDNGDELLWWFAQMLLVVPFPLLLISQIALLLLDSLAQTLIDGSSPATVYSVIAVVSFFALLPLAPFAHKLHHLLTISLAVVFVFSTIYTLNAFPFTTEENLKVWFTQSVELPPTIGDKIPSARARTTLAAVPSYIEKYILEGLPSAWERPTNCSTFNVRGPGLIGCSWDSTPLLPSPGRAPSSARDPKPEQWISFAAERTNATTARFTLSALNTRACRLYFDSRTVNGFYVQESGITAPRAAFPVPEEGIREIRLWSRTWNREWVVDVSWTGAPADGEERIKGRAACEWAEYESGAAGGTSRSGGRIPAYEEVLQFLPEWALVTKSMDGLVEAWTKFEV